MVLGVIGGPHELQGKEGCSNFSRKGMCTCFYQKVPRRLHGILGVDRLPLLGVKYSFVEPIPVIEDDLDDIFDEPILMLEDGVADRVVLPVDDIVVRVVVPVDGVADRDVCLWMVLRIGLLCLWMVVWT